MTNLNKIRQKTSGKNEYEVGKLLERVGRKAIGAKSVGHDYNRYASQLHFHDGKWEFFEFVDCVALLITHEGGLFMQYFL